MATPKVILLSPAHADMSLKEELASGAITPGHLIERDAATTVGVHSTIDSQAQKMFALEDVAASGTIDDAYITGQIVRFFNAKPGDQVYAIVDAATPAIVAGDYLSSHGNGTIQKALAAGLAAGGCLIGVALESVDNSGGGSAVRIKIEVL